MDNLNMVTHCGLYCDLCAQRGRIPCQASALIESMSKEGWDFFGEYIYDDFDSFWKILQTFSDKNSSCPACRQGGGDPECKIRDCAREHKIDVCPLCIEYPCDLIKDFAKTYPLAISDGMRMREIGLEAWIEEQTERGKNGFIYADIRCRNAHEDSEDREKNWPE
jgi:hypothetical protein